MAKHITNVNPNLINYIEYIENMKFDECPNYEYIQDIFTINKQDISFESESCNV